MSTDSSAVLERQTGLRIIRKPEVLARVGFSDQQLFNLEARGEFPRRIQTGLRSVGWVECEIDEWIANKMRQRDDVARTEAQRVARMPPAVRARYWRERDDNLRDAAEGDLPPSVRHRRRLEREGADTG